MNQTQADLLRDQEQFMVANLIFLASFSPIILPFFMKGRSLTEKLLLAWYLFDTAIHTIFDSSYAWIMLTEGSANSTNPLSVIWREYGKADSRWLIPDPEIMSIEVVVMVVMLPLTVVTLYKFYTRSSTRYFYAVLLSAFEMFGTYMTFAPEMLRGSPSLHYANPMHKYYYLAFTNGLWLWIPGLITIHAANAIHKAFEAAEGKKKFE